MVDIQKSFKKFDPKKQPNHPNLKDKIERHIMNTKAFDKKITQNSQEMPFIIPSEADIPAIQIPPHISPKNMIRKTSTVSALTKRTTCTSTALEEQKKVNIRKNTDNLNTEQEGEVNEVSCYRTKHPYNFLHNREQSSSIILKGLNPVQQQVEKRKHTRNCEAQTRESPHSLRIHNIALKASSKSRATSQTRGVKKTHLSLEEFILKEGVLLKLTKTGKWVPRYCVLQKKSFLYYNHREDQKIKACVQFNLLSCRVELKQKKSTADFLKFQIVIENCAKLFFFRSNYPKETTDWTKLITTCIENTLKANLNVALPLTLPLFYKQLRISEGILRLCAQSGDLLLFTGKTLMNKVQRIFTRSRFDHVCLLMRDKDSKLLYLESTRDEGVCAFYWEEFVDRHWNIEYSEIVYRHLYCERDKDTLHKMRQFARKAVGKAYSFNFFTFIADHFSSSSLAKAEQSQSFFCSELLAAAYVLSGVLDSSISPSKYLPGDFSAEKILPWIGTAHLSSEYVVDMSLY